MNKELFFLWDKIDKNTFYIEDHEQRVFKKDIDVQIKKMIDDLISIADWENRKVYIDIKDNKLFIIMLISLFKLKSKVVLVPSEVNIEDYYYKEGLFISDNKEYKNLIFLQNDLKLKLYEDFDPDKFESPVKDNDTIVYLYTSGSTGKSKLIPKTALNLIYEVKELNKILSITKDDIFFFTPPLCHIYGFLFGFLLPIYSSSKIVLDNRFTPDSIAKFVKKKKITIFISIPTYYRMFADLNLIDNFIQCRKLTSSSAPLPQDVSEKFYKKGIKITEVYGSTETGGIAYRVSAVNLEWKLFSYVKIFEKWDDYIENKKGEKDRREVELRINSPAISINYNKEIGFNTGDIIQFTENGTFKLLGRNTRFIKIAGKRVDLNYVLEKVKDYLAQNIDCEIKDEELYVGEKDEKIYVIFEKEFPKSSKEIKNDLNKHLPSYAVPRLLISKKIPRNNMGKINKVEIEKILNI